MAEQQRRVEFVGGPLDGDWTDMPPGSEVLVYLDRRPIALVESGRIPSASPVWRIGRYELHVPTAQVIVHTPEGPRIVRLDSTLEWRGEL